MKCVHCLSVARSQAVAFVFWRYGLMHDHRLPPQSDPFNCKKLGQIEFAYPKLFCPERGGSCDLRSQTEWWHAQYETGRATPGTSVRAVAYHNNQPTGPNVPLGQFQSCSLARHAGRERRLHVATQRGSFSPRAARFRVVRPGARD